MGLRVKGGATAAALCALASVGENKDVLRALYPPGSVQHAYLLRDLRDVLADSPDALSLCAYQLGADADTEQPAVSE